MRQLLISAAILTICPLFLFAQHNPVPITSYPIIHIAAAGSVNVKTIFSDFFPVLQPIEMPRSGTGAENDYLQSIKDRIVQHPGNEILKGERGGMPQPLMEKQFTGNPNNMGIPNDNSLAVSKEGLVVSVDNTTFCVFDSAGKMLKNVSLQAFSDTLHLKQDKYDPKALYDPIADRFIMAFLNGSNDSTNYIILAFSKTNDPTGEWNIYRLPGEPLSDTTWSDFPSIAISDEELFLTINAVQNSKSWQEGFRQTYLWQISKIDGYDGIPLTTRLRGGIKYDGKPIRNLCPVKGGSKPVGSTMYFLSDRNFALESDSVFLLRLTGRLQDTGAILYIDLLRSETGKYGVPPSARQPLKYTLQTNDARILDAFVENGFIQFVGNSVVKATGTSGIFHGSISLYTATPHLAITVLGGQGLDLGYPAIAYAGDDASDNDAVIFANHSSDTTYPGHSVFLYKNDAFSNLLRIKNGTSYMNPIPGKSQRWGDYSGAQTDYAHPGRVWVSGSYGYKQNTFTSLSGTTISELTNPLATGPVGIPSAVRNEIPLRLFPSPATLYEPVIIEFETRTGGYGNFAILSPDGKLIRTLLTQKMEPGTNRFSFIPAPLKPGMYFLSVSKDGAPFLTKKFIIK